MHTAARQFVANVMATIRTKPRAVLEIGGRNVNGTVRDLFYGAEYHAIDLLPGVGVDQVADFLDYEPPFRPDAIVCCEVLEHAPQAQAIVEKALKMLPPGGMLLLTAASPGRAPHSGVDGGALRPGEHYANVHEEELARWFGECGRPLELIRIATNPAACDVYAVAITEDARADSLH